MNALLGLIEERIPSYGEVFTQMNDKELHDAFIAYEVLCYVEVDSIIHKNAVNCLKEIAQNHNWIYNEFFDVIADEYDCLYNK